MSLQCVTKSTVDLLTIYFIINTKIIKSKHWKKKLSPLIQNYKVIIIFYNGKFS